jgi:DNA-binding MarR family transcriptional regulator
MPLDGSRKGHDVTLLRIAVERGDLTSVDARQALDVSRRTADRYLRLLVERGHVRPTVGLPGKAAPTQPCTRRRRVYVPTQTGRALVQSEQSSATSNPGTSS